MLDQGYWLALHALPGIGRVRLAQLMANFPTGISAWQSTSAQLQNIGLPSSLIQQLQDHKKNFDLELYWQQLNQANIKAVILGDSDYPQSLTTLPDAPIILYYQGSLNWPKPTISVVGSRKLTSYGRGVTEQISKALVEAGATIVSGLAYGADTIAHQAAVVAKTPTVAILGSGLNQLYPADNQQLANAITAYGGALISEYPPDQSPVAGNFPARNRIIAGLSQTIIVTEASLKSGSLITAKVALEYGRDVYAVPGPINAGQSAGTNQLLKNGASFISAVPDLLTDLGLSKSFQPKNLYLSSHETEILDLITGQPWSADQLCQHLKLPIQQINSYLIKLELAGQITNIGSQTYQKNY